MWPIFYNPEKIVLLVNGFIETFDAAPLSEDLQKDLRRIADDEWSCTDSVVEALIPLVYFSLLRSNQRIPRDRVRLLRRLIVFIEQKRLEGQLPLKPLSHAGVRDFFVACDTLNKRWSGLELEDVFAENDPNWMRIARTIFMRELHIDNIANPKPLSPAQEFAYRRRLRLSLEESIPVAVKNFVPRVRNVDDSFCIAVKLLDYGFIPGGVGELEILSGQNLPPKLQIQYAKARYDDDCFFYDDFDLGTCFCIRGRIGWDLDGNSVFVMHEGDSWMKAESEAWCLRTIEQKKLGNYSESRTSPWNESF